MKRTVHCTDAVEWLHTSHIPGDSSFIASLPDYSEFPSLSLEQWKEWFVQTAALILAKCPDTGISIFFQSDIKHDDIWVDKGFLCQKAAESVGTQLIWHKIVCRAPAGVTTFGRPSYSHMLAFSKSVRPSLDTSTADVIADGGDKVWQRGMGLKTCLIAVDFIAKSSSTKTIINPFCGQGSVLAAVNHLGLDAIGIERSPKRAKGAQCLQIAKDGKSWEE